MQHNKAENLYIFVISNNQSFISQRLKVVDPLREKLDVFSHRNIEIKAHSIRSLKRYLEGKNLTHSREAGTI